VTCFPRIALCSAVLLIFGTSVSAGERPKDWYRTQVPEITADRWTKAVPPLPKPGTVTKADYMRVIKEIHTRWWPTAKKVLEGEGTSYLPTFIRREAFFYRVDKDPKQLDLAMQFIRADYRYRTSGPGAEKPTNFVILGKATETVHWLMPGLSAEQKAFCKQWFLLLDKKYKALEYGPMNRSAGRALGLAALNHWWPDAPRHVERKRYSGTVWNDWWAERDTDENAEDYNGLFLYYVFLWKEVTGEEAAFYADPGVKAICERYLAKASTLGVLPSYGDGCGWGEDAGRWIELMERWGAAYKDGRYRWVAHRIFEYVTRHWKEMWQWGNINVNTADALMSAYLNADWSLTPVKPTLPSMVTHRKALRWMTRQQRIKTHYHSRLTGETIPNKLILRTGWDIGDTYALVELCPPMGHGHLDAGSINAFVSRGSILLSDTPYLVKDHGYHNAFVVKYHKPRKAGWGQIRNAHFAMKTTVKDFHAAGTAAAARIRIENYMGERLTHTRRYFLLGDAGLWVHDSAVGKRRAFLGSFGPAFQTTHVYGKRGENWVNMCQVTVPVAYIWDPKFMMQWNNRPRDLLVYFVPADGAAIRQDNVQVDNSFVSLPNKTFWNNFTTRVWYARQGQIAVNEPTQFSTVLLPHDPTDDATPLAEGINSLVQVEGAAAVRVPAGAGVSLIAGFNDTGKPLTAGPVETDAKWFLVRMKGDTPSGHWVVDAKTLKVDGKDVHTSAEPKTVDTLGAAK